MGSIEKLNKRTNDSAESANKSIRVMEEIKLEIKSKKKQLIVEL